MVQDTRSWVAHTGLDATCSVTAETPSPLSSGFSNIYYYTLIIQKLYVNYCCKFFLTLHIK